MILLDTNALLWLVEKNPRMGRAAVKTVDAAALRGEAMVSAVSFWEIALLRYKRRLYLADPPEIIRRQVLTSGIHEIPLDGAQAINAVRLTGLPADPADRFITAMAMSLDATLLTADDRLLDWHGGLKTRDARR